MSGWAFHFSSSCFRIFSISLFRWFVGPFTTTELHLKLIDTLTVIQRVCLQFADEIEHIQFQTLSHCCRVLLLLFSFFVFVFFFFFIKITSIFHSWRRHFYLVLGRCVAFVVFVVCVWFFFLLYVWSLRWLNEKSLIICFHFDGDTNVFRDYFYYVTVISAKWLGVCSTLHIAVRRSNSI